MGVASISWQSKWFNILRNAAIVRWQVYMLVSYTCPAVQIQWLMVAGYVPGTLCHPSKSNYRLYNWFHGVVSIVYSVRIVLRIHQHKLYISNVLASIGNWWICNYIIFNYLPISQIRDFYPIITTSITRR